MSDTWKCEHCGQRTLRRDDMRGWIAVVVILLVFGLAYAKVFLNYEEADIIAPWAASALTLVLQGYYMTKGAERHAEALRRQVKAISPTQDRRVLMPKPGGSPSERRYAGRHRLVTS